MSNKNKYYYKKNYYKKNNKPQEKKVTYDSLMEADTITEPNKKDDLNRILMIKCIALSIVILAIIIGSFILFRII